MTAQLVSGDVRGGRSHSSNAFLKLRRSVGLVTSLALLTSCAGDKQLSILEPLKIEKQKKAEFEPGVITQPLAAAATTTNASDGPSAPLGSTTVQPKALDKPPVLKGENVSVNLEGIALPTFVNTVFGDILNVTFEIDSAVQKREQIVTMRTATPLAPNDLLDLVRQVLNNYGIAVSYQNGVYRVIENAALRKDIPRIVRTRALPNVPDDMRPVFYYATLSAIPAPLMQTWLQQSFPGRFEFQSMPLGNGLLLLGQSEDVSAALDTIEVLDQPAMAGFKSMKISPAYWSADKLTAQLIEVLTAEGYFVSQGGNNTAAIKLLPVRALNTIIVFCTDQEVMNHVLQWVRDLDQPGQTIEAKGVFYHPVYNTKAGDIAEVISQLMGGGKHSSSSVTSTQGGAIPAPVTPEMMRQATSGGSSTMDQKSNTSSTSVIVDEGRNALIFQGSAEEYAQFRTLVDQMDRAPLEVLIEATIAEVTLREGQTLGAVLKFDDGAVVKPAQSVIQSSAGLIVNMVRDTGQFTAQLQALADRSRVNILSNPRVVARSGKAANITVGTQVPIITSQQTSNGQVGGTSALLQDIQYRSTGVNLRVNPTINSNRRVELSIAQEVSEAQVNNISDVQSPLILTRNISTELSLSDGETVLLGGLISENVSNSDNGIPLLKDIPIIGNVFKTTSKGRSRTELIVLLTPYIIESPETARSLRDSFRDQLTAIPPGRPSPSTMPVGAGAPDAGIAPKQ
ncbi:MAG: hypothetical protein JNM81_08470 [Rhodospirillaceae bacterium]|nr:hypothetical protein [Rhodospirillaceae bacterium]